MGVSKNSMIGNAGVDFRGVLIKFNILWFSYRIIHSR